MKKILAPHKEQDGWVYWRLKGTSAAAAAAAPSVNPLWLVRKDTLECVKASDVGIGVGYMDDTTGSRIISSRRVERAVETDDFLRLCEDEGLIVVHHWLGRWGVARGYSALHAAYPTLREAYYRYKSHAGE